jgi:hypothetical protein
MEAASRASKVRRARARCNFVNVKVSAPVFCLTQNSVHFDPYIFYAHTDAESSLFMMGANAMGKER